MLIDADMDVLTPNRLHFWLQVRPFSAQSIAREHPGLGASFDNLNYKRSAFHLMLQVFGFLYLSINLKFTSHGFGLTNIIPLGVVDF